MQGELVDMPKVIINPDENLVSEIRTKIKENNGHCACAVSFDDSNICMCKEFREQISRKELGECHCGLYIITDE